MAQDSGSLSVELGTYKEDDDYTVAYPIKGSQGREWQSSPDIPVANCDHYKVPLIFYLFSSLQDSTSVT